MRMLKKFVMILSLMGFPLPSAFGFKDAQLYENYFNQLKTLSGEFVQTNSRGHTASGTIHISRPGKMRLTYDPPSNLLIIADGKWLITKDIAADQIDYVSLENTPAALILRPHVQFRGDVEIISVIPHDETTEISLVQKDEPEAGSITLVFKNNPIALKEWRIQDPQGIETRVILSNVQSNISLSDNLFHFESPNIIQQIF